MSHQRADLAPERPRLMLVDQGGSHVRAESNAVCGVDELSKLARKQTEHHGVAATALPRKM